MSATHATQPDRQAGRVALRAVHGPESIVAPPEVPMGALPDLSLGVQGEDDLVKRGFRAVVNLPREVAAGVPLHESVGQRVYDCMEGRDCYVLFDEHEMVLNFAVPDASGDSLRLARTFGDALAAVFYPHTPPQPQVDVVYVDLSGIDDELAPRKPRLRQV